MTRVETRRPLILSLLLPALLGWSIACHTTEPPTANSNSAPATTANANQAASPSAPATDQPASTSAPAASNGAFSLATPAEAYQTAYTARQKKDIATLKRVFAKDALEFLTEMAEDNQTLDDQLKALVEKPQASTAQTRNEKINGNNATLEYLDENGKWSVMDFTKEGNEWKIDLPKGP